MGSPDQDQSQSTQQMYRAFERLRKRLLDRRVIPFVGAGISVGARADNHPDLRPSLDWMRQQLEDALCRELERLAAEEPPPSRRTELLLSLIRLQQSPPFDRLAEIGVWLWGHREVCKILQIAHFAQLNPLPAHRYLAYLAREGLICEIISTNYDTCIEEAFFRSFGPGRQQQAEAALQVIQNLRQYTKYGGQRFTEKAPYRPILHLYKINGCANKYSEYINAAKVIHETGPCFEPEAAERIILTERQLQTFRSEHWARDLFRDRARTNALLFCGFGSEEPQVRHTAMELMEEFRNASLDSEAGSPDFVALPNAPYVAAYESPSFTQLQILHAFVQAHRGSDNGCGGMEALDTACLNVVSGKHAMDLGNRDSNKLSADLFLYYFYLLGFRCVVERALEDGAPFCKWLEYRAVPVGRWRGWLHTALFPHCDDPVPALDRTFGRLRLLLAVDQNYPRGPLPLWQWLSAMDNPTAPCQSQDWYLPLLEDNLMVLCTLLLLLGLTRTHKGTAAEVRQTLLDRVRPEPGLGLKVDTVGRQSDTPDGMKTDNDGRDSQQDNDGNLTVYLVSEAATTEVSAESLKSGRLIRRLAVPSLRYLHRDRRWKQICEGDGRVGVLRVGRVLTVAAADFISRAGKPERMPQTIATVFAEDRPPAKRWLGRTE